MLNEAKRRDMNAQCRLTADELRALEAAAKSAGARTLSDWMRDLLLEAARRKG